jgi:predicted nucleic acid-binding protein
MFVLDTNVLSELRRPRPHGAVLAWIEAVELSALYIAAITVGEIQAGIERTRDNDKMKAFEIESWLEDILHRLPVLAMDAEIFRIWARLMHGRSSHLSEDAMIAADGHEAWFDDSDTEYPPLRHFRGASDQSV